MSDASTPNSTEDRQKEFLERARKGVLKFLNDKGGKLPLSELHDHSLNRYLIQHQSFSRMMESLVDAGLVEFDFQANEATITEAGRQFIAK